MRLTTFKRVQPYRKQPKPNWSPRLLNSPKPRPKTQHYLPYSTTKIRSPPCLAARAATCAAHSWFTWPAWSLSTWLFNTSTWTGPSLKLVRWFMRSTWNHLWHYHPRYYGYLKHGSWSRGGTGSFPPCELWTEFRNEVHLTNLAQFLMTGPPKHQGVQRWLKSSRQFRIDRL